MKDAAKTKKQLIAELAEMRQMSKFLSENPFPVLQIAKDNTILYANDASQPLLRDWGRKIGQSLPEFWHELIAKAFNSTRSESMEVACGNRILLFIIAPVPDAGYVNLYGNDITNCDKVEEALKISEERWRSLVTYAPDIILTVDKEGRITFINHTPSGISVDDATGTNAIDYVAPEHRELVRNSIRRVFATGTSDCYEICARSPEDKESWYSTRLGLIKHNGNVEAVVLITRDITEVKHAEEALRESESKLKSFIDSATEAFSLWDSDLNLVMNNELSMKLLKSGTDKEALIGKNILELAPDVKESGRYDKYLKVIKTGKPLYIDDIAPHPRFGDKRFLLKAFKVGDGIGMIVSDITKSKRAEEALRIKDNAIATSINGIAITDLNGNVTYGNDALVRMWGHDDIGEVLGRHARTFWQDEDKVMEVIEGLRRKGHWIDEFVGKKKDGSLFNVEFVASVVKDEKGNPLCMMGSFIDITERKQVEEQIQIYQKQLRTLMSKLSIIEEQERRRISEELHDNISQNLALSKIKLASLRESFPDISEDLKDAQELIEQTIKFTRSLTFELSPPVLYELGFISAVEWLAEQTQEKHGIMVEFVSNGIPAELNRETSVLLFKTVRELLLNIVKHAQTRKATISISSDKDNIVMNIEDRGIGFDTEKIKPYSVKNGSFGILSIRERIRYLGGTIEITSKQGQGTRVTIVVPEQYKNNNA